MDSRSFCGMLIWLIADRHKTWSAPLLPVMIYSTLDSGCVHSYWLPTLQKKMRTYQMITKANTTRHVSSGFSMNMPQGPHQEYQLESNRHQRSPGLTRMNNLTKHIERSRNLYVPHQFSTSSPDVTSDSQVVWWQISNGIQSRLADVSSEKCSKKAFETLTSPYSPSEKELRCRANNSLITKRVNGSLRPKHLYLR